MIILSDHTIKKESSEIIDVTIPFADDLASGDTIASASVTVAEFDGTDVTTSISPDDPTISGTNIVQRFKSGTSHTTYLSLIHI